MAADSQNQARLESFPTDKHKRFFYPTRPLFTFLTGVVLASLGLVGIIPMSWALWAAAAFAFDDLPFTPIMGIVTATNNLFNERKQLKAIVMIVCVSLGLVVGGLYGYYLLTHMPLFMKTVADYLLLTDCSPLLLSIGAIGGGLLAHEYKLSSLLGIGLGTLIASFLPIPVPVMVDAVYICAATGAFLSSIIAKQGLRAWFKFHYGHSNADGYQMARSQEELNTFTEGQSKKFGVSHDQFNALVEHCRDKISNYKQNASLYQEMSSSRNLVTNSFKDIYRGLMNPGLNPQQVLYVKNLLSRSQLDKNDETDPKNIFKVTMLENFGVFKTNMEDRILYHQFKIKQGNGLDMSLVNPFIKDITSESDNDMRLGGAI